jgi:hypothetical protein
LAVLYEVVAEGTSEEQVSRRRRQATSVRPYQQFNLLEPGLRVAETGDETLDQRHRDRQEDDRSYQPNY